MGYDEYASEPYGSLCFKAPEIIMGVNYDFEIDIWSLGITLYFVMFLKYKKYKMHRRQSNEQTHRRN